MFIAHMAYSEVPREEASPSTTMVRSQPVTPTKHIQDHHTHYRQRGMQRRHDKLPRLHKKSQGGQRKRMPQLGQVISQLPDGPVGRRLCYSNDPTLPSN